MRKAFALRPPSPAMLVALTALFVALGGTGYAATQFSHAAAGANIARKPHHKKPNPSDKTTDTRLIKKLALGLSVAKAGTANFATTAGGAPPTGVAGGALTGSYPNPTIASGAVTPSMLGPVPTAVVTNTGDTAVPSSITNHTVLSFDTDQVNLDGVHSTTSNPSRLTAPIDGLYEVHGEANWFPCGGSPGFMELEIYVNNLASRVGVSEVPSSTNACSAEGVSALVHLHAGDYVILTARQTTGAAASIRGTTSENAPDSPEFDMRWVGPAS